MQIRPLHVTDFDALLLAFNQSFATYFLPVHYDEKVMRNKIRVEGLVWEQSVGAFLGDEMVGFILQAGATINGKECAYNAGTGVVPEHRGKKMTAKMYQLIREHQAASGKAQEQLEVISNNQLAIHIYQKLGFEKQRELICFKATALKLKPSNYEIKAVEHQDWAQWTQFWSFEPTWQMHARAMERMGTVNQIRVVVIEGEVRGYVIFNSTNGRLWHLAVDPKYRRQGIGSALMQEMLKECSQPINCLNVDSKASETVLFLKSIGFNQLIVQFEMLYEA